MNFIFIHDCIRGYVDVKSNSLSCNLRSIKREILAKKRI